MSIADKLVTTTVAQLTPYQSARRIFSGADSQGDWLNANESPFANGYLVKDEHFNRYPDCQPSEVISAYSQYTNLDPSKVLVSRGADEGIELLIRAFCQPGVDNVLICPPTYGMYAISANTFNVGVKVAPLLPNFELDVAAINAHKTGVKLVFICAPNNPTGTVPSKTDIESIIQHFGDTALVVIDEAYIEFSPDENHCDLLEQYDNVVILRTLSKAFALAGIRCGFTLASADVIETLLKVIAPYPIADPVAQIASKALSSTGIETCKRQVSVLQETQSSLIKSLRKLPELEVVGDQKANFVLVRVPYKQALMDHLVNLNILVRDQSKQVNLDNCLRLSIGSDAQNQRLMTAITQFSERVKELS